MSASSLTDFEIVALDFWPITVPLTDTFAISSGSITSAESVYIRVTLRGGATGFGECAPFTSITGEDQLGTLAAVERLKEAVVGRSCGSLRAISGMLAERAPSAPAARCGIETAILDAFCHAAGVPMWTYFGGATRDGFETDITLPMLGREKCLQLADHWHRRGFRVLKVKVGSHVDSDIAVIHDIFARYPDTSFVVDANQGFSEPDALLLMRALQKSGVAVRMIEQPVQKSDLEAMARLRRERIYPICADESAASRQDAVALVGAGAADIINIKIMKCGVVEAFDIALYGLTAGLQIMFGGMMETRLAMGCSLAMAAGIGSVHTLDLDTPLLMAEDPLTGGYQYDGPRMVLAEGAGMGIAAQLKM
ncbi:MAG: dipeptide epimerase [candidate division Zixibacteria bacterium]|nr:dipeptide epimerase [candidate division Zixibacteria bacterium]